MTPHGRRHRRWPASVLALVAFAATVFAAPARAGAHPFGDPQTVAIASDEDRPEVVQVRWKVGGLDDLTVLGVALGLLPQDRVMLDGAVFFRDSDAATIGPSQEFAAYLLKQITVASGGRSCAGTVQPPADLAKTGVTIDYSCSAPVGTVTVAVRTLTDLNPAYQTLATGPAGERAVYRSGQYAHDWVLRDAPATSGTNLGRSAAVQIAAVVGAGLLVAVAALVLSRRLKRRRSVA
ncbi:hypothetical protein HC031_27530 [Planosporangium thailandense]|uniref:Uncharacterized protein n=1 Tax=Planosporangium thailandense TaxID=765197 RepID=A0ABX0Y5N9_9ACTN|nr:hypothetical protein [Planosporangium thailandense]NJC73447.1 hypothetical protein [Planosporangium thailandense]